MVLLSTVRLIPAHAGKTGAALPWSRPGGAHPRSRGENGGLGWSPRRSQGSSPLTRGKLTPHEGTDSLSGLIPAHAGKTLMLSSSLAAMPAHPRSRGENSGKLRYSKVVEGSSPLTRGKRLRKEAPRER